MGGRGRTAGCQLDGRLLRWEVRPERSNEDLICISTECGYSVAVFENTGQLCSFNPGTDSVTNEKL